MKALLELQKLEVAFGSFVAVKGVSLHVEEGETLGLVGESGSGKSTIAKAVAGLVPARSGEMIFDGESLVGVAPRRNVAHRQAIQMVFQNPDAALNPRLTIRRLIEEPLRLCGTLGPEPLDDQVAELLSRVGLSAQMMSRHPHQLSGGQKQRVCIARTLAARPRLVIADEAVSALDVSVQGQILNLFQALQRQSGIAYLFISHNLSVVRHVADRVAVMFFGRIVEEGDQRSIWSAPAHPYTRALIAAVPVADPVLARERRRALGIGRSEEAPPATTGCAYRSRCPLAIDRCTSETPVLTTVSGKHRAACHRADAFLGQGGPLPSAAVAPPKAPQSPEPIVLTGGIRC